MTIGDEEQTLYSYLRFYEDNVVCSQNVRALAPEKVAKWFGRNARYETMGAVDQQGDSIRIVGHHKSSYGSSGSTAPITFFTGEMVSRKQFNCQVKAPGQKPLDVVYEFYPLK